MEPNITPDDFTQSITVVVSDITDRGTAARSLSHEMKSPQWFFLPTYLE